MDEHEYREILRHIQDAHKSQIENILQYVKAGNVEAAQAVCETLLIIYKKRLTLTLNRKDKK